MATSGLNIVLIAYWGKEKAGSARTGSLEMDKAAGEECTKDLVLES